MENEDFPTLVYKKSGPHFGLNGKTYDYAPCADAEQLAAMVSGGGWFKTLEEACGVSAQEPTKPEPASRAELEAQATKLDIAFDGRTSSASLLKKIEDVLKTRTD
jgi:hypothetical protein